MINTRNATKKSNSDEGGVAAICTPLSVADVEDVVKKAVDAATHALLNELNKKFQDITDYVAVLETRIEKLEAEAEQKKEDQPDMNGNLQTTLEAIRKENQRTRAAANDTEQYGRRNNLRFRGLKVKKDESCRKTVTDFINRRLQLSISKNDIEIAHHLPNRKPKGDATQGKQLQEPVFIARFRDRNIRDSVIRERRKLKGTSCTIVEDLTSLNLEVMNKTEKIQ